MFYVYSTLHFGIFTLLLSYLYHVIILVDKVLLNPSDFPIAKTVMYSTICIVDIIFGIVSLSFLQDLL